MSILNNNILNEDRLILCKLKGFEYYKLELVNNYIGVYNSLDLVYISNYTNGKLKETSYINGIYYLKYIDNKFIVNFYKYKIIITLYEFIEKYSSNEYISKGLYCIINNKLIFRDNFLKARFSVYVTSNEFKDMKIRLNDIIKGW